MASPDRFVSRWHASRARVAADGADAVIVSLGYDLPYLIGYKPHPSERLTAFVGSAADLDATPTVIAPKIEVPLLPKSDAFNVQGWTDDEDPIAMIVNLLGDASRVLVSDEMRANNLLLLQKMMPATEFVSFSGSLGGLRSVKTDDEMQAIQTVGGLASEVAAQIQRGEMPLVGRTEKEIAKDISSRLREIGHETVEFCIVASGPNSASPHHNPTDRVVQANEMVLMDFGGKHKGYCSDITRCVWTGPIPDEVAATYATLKAAQQAAVDAARPGASLGDVDYAARSVIDDSGFGEYFIHRTGHGIGTEVHEQPEPGIYINGKWGMRLEDIVVIVDDGAIRCSTTNHDLISLPS